MLVPTILASAEAAHATESAGGVSELLGHFGVDWKIVIAQMVNFALVVFALWKFAYKPVVATLDERQTKIAEGLKFAEEAKQQLKDATAKQADVLRAANLEAQKIVADARQVAKDMADRQLAETSTKVEDMLRRGQEANELERQKILGEVRQEIARLVVETSAKVLQTELDAGQRERFNAAAVREVARSN